MTDTAIGTAPAARAGGVKSVDARERRFFLILTLIAALAIVVGFIPSFYLKDVIHAPPPLSAMSRVHGFVYTAWLLLFVTQVTLIDRGNAALHRRLGLVGAVLLGVVLAVGVMTGLNAARLNHAPPGVGAPLVFLSVPLSAIAAIGVLYLSALWNRLKRDQHMRYMLAAFIAMTPPGTHRIILGMLGFPNQALVSSFIIMDGLLVAAMLADIVLRGRVNRAYLWSALAYVASEVFVVWAYQSPAWLSAAHWLIQT